MAARYIARLPSARLRTDCSDVHAWYGIRYAYAERFSPPVAAEGQLQVLELQEVPIFPQLPSRLSAAMGDGLVNPQSEDAFYLNVWAPADASDLPVLLFIHGGAWMTGGGAMNWYAGTRLAAQGFVVVTVNYRLAALGHLGKADAHPLPLPAVDLLLALRWVISNVSSHGGDPERITLVGQSAGGWYAHLLSVLPETKGMVHRVALLSMGTRAPWSPLVQAEVTERVQRHLKGDLDRALAHEVLKAGMAALRRESPQLGYAPSAFLPVASKGLPPALLDPHWAATACHAQAVYVRNTAHECAAFFFNDLAYRRASQEHVDQALVGWSVSDLPGSLLGDGRLAGADSRLSPYRQLVAAASWRQFERFPAEYAAQLRLAGKHVQTARFNVESALDGFHSGHCFDLPFQFGNFEAWADAPMLGGIDADSFEAISQTWMLDLSGFVQG